MLGTPPTKPINKIRPPQPSEDSAASKRSPPIGSKDTLAPLPSVSAIPRSGRRAGAEVGAGLAPRGRFVGGARRREAARAHRLADLARRQAAAARGAEHQERLAGLETALPADGDVARDVRNRERARLVERHRARDGE